MEVVEHLYLSLVSTQRFVLFGCDKLNQGWKFGLGQSFKIVRNQESPVRLIRLVSIRGTCLGEF